MVLDMDYEGWAGRQRLRTAYTGGSWCQVVAIDIGRAKRADYQNNEKPEDCSIMGKHFLPGRRGKSQETMEIYRYLLQAGEKSLTEICLVTGAPRKITMNMLLRNDDLFERSGFSRYKAISSESFKDR